MIHTSETVREWLGYLFKDELNALKMLAHGLPSNPVVINIGAGGGTSGLAFKESRPDLTLITIDIQNESSPFGCLEAERTVMEGAGYALGSGWYQIWGDSVRVGKNWISCRMPIDEFEDGTILYSIQPEIAKADLVFIDGDHSYEGCRGDIEAWLPNIKSGGIIAIHDYDKRNVYSRPDDGFKKPHPKEWPGVDRAVQELLIDKYKQILLIDTLIAFRI